MASDELAGLRDQIGAIDREVLDALNRRLELVRRVRAHKQEAGAPIIDAAREAELLDELVGANAGPLGERAVRSLFAAVLDVMKQESQGSSAAAPAASRAPAPVARLAIVGTGLLGTSIALAARRAGVASVRGFDTDAAMLREAAVERAPSLADAVAGAELVVVSVPVGAVVTTVRDALAAAPEATVTDVGSTKRVLAAVEDPRFVAGHPLAGGATGGPGRASADLFDGAVWFLTPSPSADASRVEIVRGFVAALGARTVELDPAEHDRLLAVTSHLPHALANLLMRAAARAGEDALGYAGASLREMTRVAGANPSVWADIFIENGDLIAAALSELGDELADIERALRNAERDTIETWIGASATARTRMLEYAYRTDAKMLNRIRVRIPDKPGVLARITQTLGAAGINIEDFELRHVSPEYGGVLVILVAGGDQAALARTLLRREGYSAA
ncbi:MAG: prephenate dehydrogenase/arogenate dehydrogenase family protein [Acidobacteriota bacterium]|nr:prephenate dehydrogenase/arogenate dehydrogenase family protein [Acidobacteriota bacterium]